MPHADTNYVSGRRVKGANAWHEPSSAITHEQQQQLSQSGVSLVHLHTLSRSGNILAGGASLTAIMQHVPRTTLLSHTEHSRILAERRPSKRAQWLLGVCTSYKAGRAPTTEVEGLPASFVSRSLISFRASAGV